MLDSLEDELMVVDRDYRIIEANAAVSKKHGKRREEIIGQPCYEISHGLPKPCRSPYHECPIRKVWQTGKPARVTHIHTYRINGKKQERLVDIIATPIRDSRNKVTAVVELMRDVTEARELELRIAEAQRHLLALNSIATVVSQSLDLDVVLSSALDKTLEIMDATTGGILLWDEEKQMLCYRAHHGLSRDYAEGACFHSGEGIAGRVMQTGDAILVEDVSKDTRAASPDLIATKELRAFASVPLRSKEKILGVLNIASHGIRIFSSRDVQLLNSIAAQIAIAVENAKLHQELQRKEEIRGELLREIFSIQEEERRRLARELHDETSQSLASIAAKLEAASGILPGNIEKVKRILKEAQSISINILDEVHKLIYQLRPTLLDDLGLVSAIRWLADNNLKPAGIRLSFKTTGQERRLPAPVEATLFRVIQEAITNIARHAHARNARITLHFKKRSARVCVKDNGKGFDVEEAIASKERPRGLGLIGMKERVELMNGTLTILSQPRVGTEICIEIPVNAEEVINGQNKNTGGR